MNSRRSLQSFASNRAPDPRRSAPDCGPDSAPLPRFELDHEQGHEHERASLGDCEETWDPADTAATVERSPISDAFARRLLRPVGASPKYAKRGSFPILSPSEPSEPSESSESSESSEQDSEEEEIAAEDILLEVYPEPQAPPPASAAPASAVVKRASAPPPLDLASLGAARIDALLRSELPPSSPPPPLPLVSQPLFTQSASSIAPVALSQRPPFEQGREPERPLEIAAAPSLPWTAPPPRQATGWGRATMIALFAAGLAVGLTFTVTAPAGSLARARAFGASLVAKVKPRAAAPSQPSGAANSAVTPAAPVALPTPGVTSATGSGSNTVPVDALPKVEIEPGKTLVTFPPSSEGHRIFVDGVVLSTGSAPAKLKCGTHNIRIGSAGKVRKVDLPCGQTYELR